MRHLDEVLGILESESLFAKEAKCEFGMAKLLYLGHIISSNGVRVDPEEYLRNYVSEQLKLWIKLHIGEYCYNSIFDMSIRMSPFMALYGYEAPSFVELLFGDCRVPRARDLLQESQDIMRSLRENIQHAQNQQKLYADQHCVERVFEVGDMVYVQLQPYKQYTLKKSGAEKLKPWFYGPFRVIRRVGEVAYELKLLEDSKVHNVFHVSCLKKALGRNVVPCTELSPLDEEGKWILILESILEVHERTLRRRVIKEYLVKWKNFPLEDATWESEQILQHLELRLLEEKQSWEGWTVMSPSPS